jgi:transposase
MSSGTASNLLLPGNSRRHGCRWSDHRTVVNGVLWRTRTGSPWRDVPPVDRPCKTVYNRHRRWSADVPWERVLSGLQAGSDADPDGEWMVSVDATVVRAHHHAAGARHGALPADVRVARGLTGGCVELHEFAS